MSRERCVECGHFIYPDIAPSPPAPVEVSDAPMTQADYLRACIAWIDDPEMREIAKWHINDAADEFSIQLEVLGLEAAGNAIARDEAVALERVVSVLTDDMAECKDHLAAATAEAERLTKAIQDYLDGNYDSPRAKRPGKCRHGTWYYEACEECVDDHFRAALTPAAKLD